MCKHSNVFNCIPLVSAPTYRYRQASHRSESLHTSLDTTAIPVSHSIKHDPSVHGGLATHPGHCTHGSCVTPPLCLSSLLRRGGWQPPHLVGTYRRSVHSTAATRRTSRAALRDAKAYRASRSRGALAHVASEMPATSLPACIPPCIQHAHHIMHILHTHHARTHHARTMSTPLGD